MDFGRLWDGIILGASMAAISCFMKFVFFEENIKFFLISKSGRVGGCSSPRDDHFACKFMVAISRFQKFAKCCQIFMIDVLQPALYILLSSHAC